MISLLQQPSGVIGSREALIELGKKKEASVLVLSDSHGRAEIVRTIIDNFGKRCDALVFCGDGIGDLCAALEYARKSKKFLKDFPPVVVFARGNGDYPDFPVNFNPDPEVLPDSHDYEIEVPLHENLKVAGMNILVTHGHAEGSYYGLGRMNQVALENQADIVFYGHTHIAARQEMECTYFINPGSCSHPRGGQPASFAIVRIPGGQERAETRFFSIKLSLAEGFDFMPFVPLPYF